MSEPVRVEALEQGAVWRAVLATPPGNVLDAPKVAALRSLFERARAERGLKAILLCAEGSHFCFGASVEEHLPARFGRMLRDFHGMLDALVDCAVPCLAAVRGLCLGGGLELASFCHRLLAAPGAKLGQPEIALGVFAPAASFVLAERTGRGRAEDLCLSGRRVDAAEALRMGLVDELAEDPEGAALEYARAHLLPRSASSLRFAVRAARGDFQARFRARAAELERLYAELMATGDAVEGLEAFLEKREPRWSDA